MLAYTIYRGVAGEWLDAAYLETADRMRRAAHDKVDDNGLVQDVCGAPHFDHPGTAAEGQAFFLLMEAAYRDCLAHDSVQVEAWVRPHKESGRAFAHVCFHSGPIFRIISKVASQGATLDQMYITVTVANSRLQEG